MRRSFTNILSLLFVLTFVQASAQNISTIVGGLGDNGAATAGKLYNPNSVTVDKFGNIFISDYGNNLIRKIDATGTITSFASVYQPYGITTDTFGNVYVADISGRSILKINTAGTISTIAGAHGGGDAGDGGPATLAQLTPSALAFDQLGNLYATDLNFSSRKVRKINTYGIITTVAGNGPAGFSGDGFAATLAKLSYPNGVAADRMGNIFISDQVTNRVRKVSPSGIITTYAGNGGTGSAGDGGPATNANLNFVSGVATDTSGNILIVDKSNNLIRSVNTSGIINRIAGTVGLGAFSGDGAAATAAQLNAPSGCAYDANGNIYIADNNNHRIRKVDVAGNISTIAGCNFNSAQGYFGDGSPGISALLNLPSGLAYDTSGNLYIADRNNNRVRKVNTSGIITTFAGTGIAGYNGDLIAATSAMLSGPASVATDRKGNVYICDADNMRIRKVDAAGIITTYAGNGVAVYGGDGMRADSASFVNPVSILTDAIGNLFVSDASNARIRKIDTNQIISTYAGIGTGGYFGDGGPATTAQIRQYGIAFNQSGNLLIADRYNNSVRKIDAAGIISTVAGNGSSSFSGMGGPAVLAGIGPPLGVRTDNLNNLYISTSQRILKVDTAGLISVFAGNGGTGSAGDGGPATAASVNSTAGLIFDSSGNLLIADVGNSRIRIVHNAKITVTALNDTICTGSGTTFTANVNAASVYTPHYRWIKNGTSVGSDSISYTSPILANGDIVYCYITNGATGPTIAESNRKTMTVISPSALPSFVAYSISGTNICTGTTVTCSTTSVVNGGSAPVFDWYKNRVHVFTGPLYMFVASDRDTVRCKLTSSSPCLLYDTALSANIVFSVQAPAYPTINITTSSIPGGGTRYCAGSNAYCYINSRTLDVSPTFEWFVNGIDVNSGFSFNFTPQNGDFVVCRMITHATCIITDTVYSNSLVFAVDSPANPSVTITSDTGTLICSGTRVKCTAAPVLGGTSPNYSWYVNGTLKYTGSSTYTFTPIDGDSVYCTIRSNSNCVLKDTATSNPLKFTYATRLPASVSITISPSDTVCLGENLTATAIPVNGGTAPRYRWHLGYNYVDAGPTYSWTPTSDYPVFCEMFSSICTSPQPAYSDTFHIHLKLDAPRVTIAANPGNTVCSGVPVVVTATGINEGTAPVYDWYQNGNQVFTGNPFTFLPSDRDSVICRLTSNATCLNWPVIYSTPTYFHIDSAPTISISCVPGKVNFKGTSVTLNASVASRSGYYALQWFKNNTVIPGATNAAYTSSDFSIWDSVYCTLTSSGACVGSVNSNTLVMQSYHSMRLYPNPNNGNFTISGNNYDANDNPVGIRIYNAAGKLVYEKDAAFDAITFHTDINLGRTLPPGVYTLKLKYSLENLSFFFVIK